MCIEQRRKEIVDKVQIDGPHENWPGKKITANFLPYYDVEAPWQKHERHQRLLHQKQRNILSYVHHLSQESQ
jgi:hypothetical protein